MGYQFDGATKRITLTAGTTVLAVRELWSRACDWLAEGDNSKWGEVARQVGGDTASIPIYLFLLNGWRVVPQSADHVLTVNDGVLDVDGGGDPFVDPPGNWRIRFYLEKPGIAIGYSTDGAASAPTANQIAEAVRAALVAAVIPVDVAKVNSVQIKGTGVPGDTWGPA